MEQIQVQQVKSFVIILKGTCALEGILKQHTVIICKEHGKDAEAVLEVHKQFEDTYQEEEIILPEELMTLLTNDKVLDIYSHDEIEPEEPIFQLDGFNYDMEIKVNGKGKKYEFEGCNAVAFPLTEVLTKFYESVVEGNYEKRIVSISKIEK